jgi:transposase
MAENKSTESVQEIIESARKQIAEEKNLSPSLRITFELLINLVCMLLEKRVRKNSKNSSVSPANDQNRKKEPKQKTGKKPGGQEHHKGTRLEPKKDPDIVVELKIDRKKLPQGNWKVAGIEKRQIFEIKTYLVVTEYQAEILENEYGEKVVADFPDGLVQVAQYGNTVKAEAVYLSVYQLIPCDRVSEQFADQYNIPISSGSVCNFKKEAYNALEIYETWVKKRLQNEAVLNLDETGINVGGKRAWIHNASSENFTFSYAHSNRGKTAMDKMGIIENTDAVLVHDHWKPYYSYKGKTHALCNEHHKRELEYETESGIKWAEPMSNLLLETNELTTKAGGVLGIEEQKRVRKKYRKILADAEIECPPPPPRPDGKRGKVKKTKARNLLERLRDFEDDVLRFMTDVNVPFTNNLAERDLRMNKVQQKISGCFRSIENANIFCRIRGFLSTCDKNNVSATDALNLLFHGKLPDFIKLAE